MIQEASADYAEKNDETRTRNKELETMN